ncbi:MAG: hypothetical protein ABI184_06410 [Ginsengibacter sp.]
MSKLEKMISHCTPWSKSPGKNGCVLQLVASWRTSAVSRRALTLLHICLS